MAKRPTARARASRVTSATSTTPALANLKSEYLLSQQGNSRLTKKSKRDQKHDALLARVREGSGISKGGRSRGNGTSKTRRPNKKLKTDLDEMKSALEDVEMEVENSSGDNGAEKSGPYAEDEWEWEGVSDTSQTKGEGEDDDSMAISGITNIGKLRRRRRKVPAAEGGKMVMKSLKHRPGSMKRKKVLEEREMERFKRNLAELAKAESQQVVATGAGSGNAGTGGQEHIQQRWKALREFIGGTIVKEKAFVGT
ncbi:hypothetical protein CB0940_10958 [Cercospora beticola]|uniref:Ribosome biogenesis protein SLX9 n=1 Tax=Cercospora beticola TaxID=122368 RepID=A0A2G5HDR7_CERBT|nr:hypothetical protein CB0940_10958 [Cercospora beticola]PIA90372.1 hypothetical protein CB0940_10958 [Cercospora beticola]WPB07693.1 hypothetical protein RHO25_012354 [Cercospora beticola]CAK1356502.1 unnamed protein product [Cercospora beticola]